MRLEGELQHLKILNKSYLSKLRRSTTEQDPLKQELESTMAALNIHTIALQIAVQKLQQIPIDTEENFCQDCKFVITIGTRYHCQKFNLQQEISPESGCSQNKTEMITVQSLLNEAQEKLTG